MIRRWMILVRLKSNQTAMKNWDLRVLFGQGGAWWTHFASAAGSTLEAPSVFRNSNFKTKHAFVSSRQEKAVILSFVKKLLCGWWVGSLFRIQPNQNKNWKITNCSNQNSLDYVWVIFFSKIPWFGLICDLGFEDRIKLNHLSVLKCVKFQEIYIMCK